MRNNYLSLLLVMLTLPLTGIAQTNIAPLATPSHSTLVVSGAGIYGPTNYNDGVISPGTFGWVGADNTSGTNAWIEFEWPVEESINKITFYPDDINTRTLTGATIQYWDGSAWVSHYSYNVAPSNMYSIIFYPVVTTKIRITNFTMTGSFQGNPSLNEIEIFRAKEGMDNAGLGVLLSPKYGCAGEYDVMVEVYNYGHNQLSNVTVEWELSSSGSQTPFYLNQTLDTIGGTGVIYEVVNLGTVTLAPGTEQLKIWTDSPNNGTDVVNYNDTITKLFNVLPTVATFPYVEDFENGQADWNPSGATSSWAFGTPAKPVINSAASGVNCFVTGGLSGTYTTLEKSAVSSPCFDMTDFEAEPWVALDIWWESEFSWDGAALQYSEDAGTTWKLLGDLGDPYNWYTDNSISGAPGGQQTGWSGTVSSGNGSGGWVKAKHPLPASLKGNRFVAFRVAFGADGFVEEEGVAFDNFIVTDYKRANLGPNQLSLCGGTQLVLDPNVTYPGEIEWSNGDTISPTINVTAPGQYWVQFTDSLLDLTSGDTVQVINTVPPDIQFTKVTDTAAVTSSITIDPQVDFENNFLWQPGDFTYPYLLVKGQDYGLGAHTFTLTVTDSVLCTDQAIAIAVFVDITGIDENKPVQVLFYPNPVKEQVSVQLSNVKADRLNVYNMSGQLVDSKAIGNSSTFQQDMRNFDSGTYLFEILAGDERIVQRIVKE